MSVVTKLEKLREVALDQHGFVTTAQALEEGISYADLSMMVARDRLTRVAHGVYRVSQVAETEYDQYELALLWTGVPEACLSHDTALQVWDISDIIPARIHLTVAHHRRLRRSGGNQYVLHYEDLADDQITWWQGVRVVNVSTAICQGIASGIPTYLIRQALDRGESTNLLSYDDYLRLIEELKARDVSAA